MEVTLLLLLSRDLIKIDVKGFFHYETIKIIINKNNFALLSLNSSLYLPANRSFGMKFGLGKHTGMTYLDFLTGRSKTIMAISL